MASPLDGKIALVTGAGAGIGRATAVSFARAGAKVLVSDINEDGGQKTVELIQQVDGEASFFHADVSVSGEVEALVRETVRIYGRMDCAFNNAGIEGTTASTHECSEDNWDRTLAINLKGVWLSMKHEIDQMLRQGGGVIVNMSSVAGLVGFAELPAYVASKHGVVGLTKTAALEYAGKGIRINAVCPGVIQTEMIDRITGGQSEAEKEFIGYEPVGRMGRPEEVAEAVLWLCSDSASFVTGHAMVIDGGFVAR